jgi:hypothetical protein
MKSSIEQQLYATRLDFKAQMQRAIKCRTKKQKIKLANEWKEKYSEIAYKELIACARSEYYRSRIANWNLDEQF